MKKVLTFLTLAVALVAVSCAKEQDGPASGTAKVTFTVDAGQIATRAISGTHGTATRLQVGVYIKNGTDYNYVSVLSQNNTVTEWPTVVSLELAKKETYKLVFWADEGTDAYTIDWTNGTVVETATTIAGNLINRDAYYKLVELTTTGAASGEAITLVRPLAQVNVGTSDLASYKAAADYTGNVETQVVISGVAPGLNLLTGAATSGETKTLTFSYANNLDATLVSDSKNYDYMALNYILCPADATLTAAVSLRKENVTTETINDFTVSYMPVKQNYRTNIVGKLLTGTVYYTVDVDTNFINDLNKPIGPTFSSLADLNTYLGTLKEGTSDGDNGDVTPEQAILTAMGDLSGISGNPQVILPKIHGDVDIRLVFPYAGTLEVVYADGATDAQKPANIYFYAQKLNTLEATVPASHFELLSGSIVTNKAVVSTNTTTFVIQNGAKVGTAEIQKGNANIAGTVGTVSVPTGATADGTSPVQVFLEKVSSVDKIELAAKTDVVVEQPKDQIEVTETEKKVAVYVNEGADNSTAKAQNGGVIYVKAKVPCTVTADGTSEAEDGTAVSSTVIIESTAAGSSVNATNGGSIDLTANGNCSASAGGVAEGQGSEPDTPSTITVVEVKDDTIVIDANTSDGGEIDNESGDPGAVKYFVAQIVGGAKYESLYDAVAAAEAGAKIEMINNSTETKGFTLTKSLTIDLCEYTVSYDSSAGTAQFPNTRAIKIAGTEAITVTIENGTIAVQDNIYGPFRFENEQADIVLNDLVLNNGMAYGLGIKLVSANSLAMEGCTVNSVVGGGLEQNYACDVTISDCVFNQTELDTQHPWISSAVSVCYDGYIEIDSGSYSGHTAAFVFSSGGMINISGGTFVGRDAAINVQNNTWEPGYAASSEVNVSGGTFTGPLKVSGWGGAGTSPVSALNISGGSFTADAGKLFEETPPGTISITGGTFSEDPTAYVEEGYIAINNGDGTWTVVEDAVAQIGTKTYGTLAKAFAAVKANEEIVVLKNCEVKDHIDVDKSPVTLNLNGFTVKNSVTYARMFDVTASNGKLTINGNGKIYIDANENVNSYGFVRLQAYGSEFILDHAELEGVTENAALLRFNNGGQSMEIKNNSKLTLTAGPNVTNKGRGTIIYNYGMNNTLSITDTDIYNYCEAPQWSAMISMENRSCTFENVRYYSETGPTGFYTGAATYTNCSIELQRTGTLNIDWSYPWLMSAVSTSSAKSVTINSGTYKGYYGIFVYSSGGAITVKDGTFEGTEAVINSENNTWEPGYAGASSINIEGGDFTGQIKAAGWGAAGTSPVAAINISGGKFKVDSSKALFTPSNASILVSGGVFSQDPTAYLLSGYQVIQNTGADADVYPFKVVAAD